MSVSLRPIHHAQRLNLFAGQTNEETIGDAPSPEGRQVRKARKGGTPLRHESGKHSAQRQREFGRAGNKVKANVSEISPEITPVTGGGDNQLVMCIKNHIALSFYAADIVLLSIFMWTAKIQLLFNPDAKNRLQKC